MTHISIMLIAVLFLFISSANASWLSTADIELDNGDKGTISIIFYDNYEVSFYGDGLHDGYLPGPDRAMGTADDLYIAPVADLPPDSFLHKFWEYDVVDITGDILNYVNNYKPNGSNFGYRHYVSYDGEYSDIQYHGLFDWWDPAASTSFPTYLSFDGTNGTVVSEEGQFVDDSNVPVPEPSTAFLFLTGITLLCKCLRQSHKLTV